MRYPSSHQIDLTFPEVVSATAAGSLLIQLPDVCFLCFSLNLIWPVPETLHLTWTSDKGEKLLYFPLLRTVRVPFETYGSSKLSSSRK